MKADDSGAVAVLAEKPSVARDIARVLGADKRGEGYLEGHGYIVTWAIGHLAALAQPHEMRPEWKQWRLDLLPMLPEAWPLVVYERTRPQFDIVSRILQSPRVSRIVCATDAGREGELIFRYVYQAAGLRKPFDRLWISSLTPDAIRRGFAQLRPGGEYDRLADAACGRSRADWLVGMNLSRAYSIAYREELSVGRVQTPTLAMLVERELALRRFVPEDYIEVQVTFENPASEDRAQSRYRGIWFRESGDNPEARAKASRLPPDGVEAESIVSRARTGKAAIESLSEQTQRLQPPLNYDLTDLQRHANRLFGFSAQQTLDLAQSLYERHKLISYPRTDSRHLTGDIAAALPAIVEAVAGPYRQFCAQDTGLRPPGRRYIDDGKVKDHHAIVPTAVSPEKARLSSEEAKIYDLICRRLLMMWQEDHLLAVTEAITAIDCDGLVDRYRTLGTAVLRMGWKSLEHRPGNRAPGNGLKDKEEDPEEAILPATLRKGQVQQVVDAVAGRKKTRPPRRFSEATLLTAMETAGRTLEEKELSDAMRDSGLGTPATRAAIIEVLLKRGYIVRTGKALEATEKGIHLIEVVHPEVKSPAMTGQWEAFLKRIERGEAQLEPFLEGIRDYVRSVVARAAVERGVMESGVTERAVTERTQLLTTEQPGHTVPPAPASLAPPQTVAQKTAGAGQSLTELLQSAFGFSKFLPNQEEVCGAVTAGKDVLLVMPTGSGKSLCYQLPGLARGGTTLVVSPLIALMDDQARSLKSRGFAVECIHSGRERESSRRACADYLAGRLQFLFIAPERLRIPGFAEMLAKRKPQLIAIDEAHCISQWGHDFRPDYRMVGGYLPALRPAPVIALTATATPVVQRDISAQLGLHAASHFIHGFRRENIGIEVVEAAPSRRPRIVREILLDAGRRPAIVYAPTRKQTEGLAAEISRDLRAAGYHAGLDSERRRRVQQDFMEGRLEVIVATTAFGMGIDKPDVRTVIHAASPGSLEGYYQEIGRAGRDGNPSRAVLMYSYADRHAHDFFFSRDYPEVGLLDRVAEKLRTEGQPKEELRKALQMEQEVFERVLEKLWVHGGASVDAAENVSRGDRPWRESYLQVGELRRAQVDRMIRFAESSECRMVALVRHFGDESDRAGACGLCDFCDPAKCIVRSFRPAAAFEIAAAEKILQALRPLAARSTGKLHAEICQGKEIARDDFEEILGAMARAGLLAFADAAFEKEGRSIAYRTVSLTREGREKGLKGVGAVLSMAVSIAVKDKIGISPEPPRRVSRSARPAKAPAQANVTKTAGRQKAGRRPASAAPEKSAPGEQQLRMEQALRAWRAVEARRRKIPAFRIFADRTLLGIAANRPTTEAELLAISGVGMSTVQRYGAQIFHLVAESS